MILTLIASLTMAANNNNFYGIAQNQHFIVNSNGEGYYIENDLNINKGDTVLIVNDNVYVVDTAE